MKFGCHFQNLNAPLGTHGPIKHRVFPKIEEPSPSIEMSDQSQRHELQNHVAYLVLEWPSVATIHVGIHVWRYPEDEVI